MINPRVSCIKCGGSLIGKVGFDVFAPGGAAKLGCMSAKGAREVVAFARAFKNGERVFEIESRLALAGGAVAGVEAEALLMNKALQEGEQAGIGARKIEEIEQVVKKGEVMVLDKDLIPYGNKELQEIFKNFDKKAESILGKRDVLDILKPDGKWIGKEGTDYTIRVFQGGSNEGAKMFQALTKDGKLWLQEKDKCVYVLSDNTYISYRPISKSGPPTIDVKFSDMKKPIKIKFVE